MAGPVAGGGGGVRAVAAGPAVRGRRPRRSRLVGHRLLRRARGCERRCSAPDPASTIDLPPALAGLEVLRGRASTGHRTPVAAAVVHDRRAGSVSIVVPVQGAGSRWRRRREQDGLLAGWGAALAPLARARCPVSRVTWQEWSHPVGVAGHREFLAGLDRAAPRRRRAIGLRRAARRAGAGARSPTRCSLTVTRRPAPGPPAARHVAPLAAAIDVLVDETPPAGGPVGVGRAAASDRPLSPLELSTGDPVAVATRPGPAASTRCAGRWPPRSGGGRWSGVRWRSRRTGSTPGSTARVHRSYRVAAWPMLPVAADWLAPLLTVRRRDPHGDGRAGAGAAGPGGGRTPTGS